MAYQNMLRAIDSLLCRLVIVIRELSQKKNDIDREVEVYKADIAERRTCIETTRALIKALEEDTDMKRNTLKHNRAVAKSMKVTQGLLLQYKHTLKAELESVKASYINDKKVFEEKIASYKKLFQEHQKPFAQKLQAQNDDTESPIIASQDDVTVNAKEGGGAYITDSGAPCSSSEKGPASDLHLECTKADMEMESSPVMESLTVFSAVNVNETKRCLSSPQTSADGNPEEMDAQSEAHESFFCSTDETRSSEQHVRAEDHRGPDEMSSEGEEDKEIGPLSQAKQSTVSEEEEAAREQMEEGGPAEEEELAPQEHAALLPLQCEQTKPQSSPVPGTPTFHFNFSPTQSPVQGLSDSKSPAFVFSLSSNPSTPGYAGFVFDAVPSHDEALSFPFSSSFFTDKKNQETKSGDLDFLFNQPEQSDNFQFLFTSESPTDNKDITTDFPFSFNF
ncbi:uncharacterized protein LOC133411028 isoform X1 [Phycodurus eques]|uniref:uncharacterized protein LOC133411028 isoform X1 n=2 Tax=Phycodurus eques TaxID=693459 RepID=UPI002ACDD8B5|nr:uncharacterized protein LOC133411028 isoform X1 [Phycodurus eques]